MFDPKSQNSLLKIEIKNRIKRLLLRSKNERFYINNDYKNNELSKKNHRTSSLYKNDGSK